MKKALVVCALGLLIILGACRKTTEPELTDEQAIDEILRSSGYLEPYDELGTFGGTQGEQGEGIEILKDTLGNGLVHWGREITNHDVKIEIFISGDTANVEVKRYIQGILHIVEWRPDTAIHYEKPLNHLGKRYFLFVREGDREGRHRGWVLKQLSNAEGESQDTLTINIQELTVQSAGYDTTVTNPLELWNKEDVFTFAPGDSVHIIMKVDNPSCIPVLHPSLRHRRLMHPVPGQPGVYEGFYRVPLEPGIYHAAFDALLWDCVMVSEYPYEDANLWLFVYRVR